jgi:hypothetical protein
MDNLNYFRRREKVQWHNERSVKDHRTIELESTVTATIGALASPIIPQINTKQHGAKNIIKFQQKNVITRPLNTEIRRNRQPISVAPQTPNPNSPNTEAAAHLPSSLSL